MSRGSLKPLAGAPLYGLATAVVAGLGLAVYLNSALVRLDLAVVRLLHRLGSDELTLLANGVTALAATTSVLLVAAVAAAALLARGHWPGALAVVLAVGATQAIVFAIKELVARARPPASTAWIDAAGHAFPSAHAASGVALYGLLAVYTLQRLHGRARAAVGAVALVGVGSIGLTRVYLGAHYPSDVLAGWLVGAVVAAAAWQLARALRGLPRVAVTT
jgi:membrane-associated phospholipid phosphatase